MTDRPSTSILGFRSAALPGGTFVKSLYHPGLMRLSDKGGASKVIGSVWSEIVSVELSASVGKPLMVEHPILGGAVVDAVHRLDSMPEVAARASKAHLKNPDFLVVAALEGKQAVFGVDAKFSIETAESSQVSADTVSKLVASDPQLSALLPTVSLEMHCVDGLFASPKYELTYEMFDHRVGFRRCSVSRERVLLVAVAGGAAFAQAGDQRIMQFLIDEDALPIDVWASLLATQYYVRLERAVSGLVHEQRRPLLGDQSAAMHPNDAFRDVSARSANHQSAWSMVVAWDRDLEEVRRQRQTLQQAIGTPIGGPELLEASHQLMRSLNIVNRPSRNQIRKSLSRRYAHDVRARVGVIRAPVHDFSAELHRVAEIADDVGRAYRSDLESILKDVILEVSTGIPDAPAARPFPNES